MKSKKLGRISSKTKTEIFKASVFDTSTHKTERTAVAILMHWMREIITEKNLDLGLPDVETSGDDRKMPDTIIYESRRSQDVLCVIEAKPPYYDVFDEEELKEPARLKATHRKAQYFATYNFKRLIWFNTEKVNALKPEEEQIVDKYQLSELEDLDDIEQTRYREPIKRGLEDFLIKLYSVYSGKEPEPKQAIDDFLIFRLQEKIRTLSTYYRRVIDDQCHKDPSFAKQLKIWFVDQGWSFAWQPQDFDKAARQTAYLLVNKILFYNLLQAKRPEALDPLDVPEGLTKGAVLQTTLQGYFNQVLKIDYETIYTTDFIDAIAFPDAKEVVKEIRELVTVLKRYDFSKLGYDIIGRIFERLIPQDERHNLGQYFTNPDIVDLILRFCLQHEDDKILDPACGAGTFLVRAYQHKKLMNQYKRHEEILDTLWGNDIAKFPAHLATINLAINDLGVDKNYPNVLQEDFFTLLVGDEGFDPQKWRRARARTLRLEERQVIYPRWFNAVVGNPPYTRQEEISEISPEDADYKKELISKALLDLGGKKIAEIGKRAGIHAYFFVHGTKFLKDKGYFGFIVSNSWLDVDYGKGLQEFFLNNYKIIAIIESKVERWFEEADINTCIVILQKCKDKKERDENLVRFVYLKKPLRSFIPPAQDMWEKQVERINAIDKLEKTILAHSELYENEDLRIYPKSQCELWNEGFDTETGKYGGAKWGKYLRAPDIFFTIMKKGKGKLVPLKEIADVRFGIKTGANDFFYFTEEEISRSGIEKKFFKPLLFSQKEINSIIVEKDKLANYLFYCNVPKNKIKNKNVLNYIKWGESKGFSKRPSVKGRRFWYGIDEQKLPDFASNRFIGERFLFAEVKDVAVCDVFFVGYLKEKTYKANVIGLLNSTLIFLMMDVIARKTYGIGVMYIYGPEISNLITLHPQYITEKNSQMITAILKKMRIRKIENIYKEFGASSPDEVSLDKIMPDRRELDKIIMGDILGLTEVEQLDVYRAVLDLVKSRIEKAKSFGKQKKTKEGIDIDALVATVMGKVGDEPLGKFYRERILTRRSLATKNLPKASGTAKIEPEMYGWRLYYSDKKYIVCPSEEEARYLKIFLESGLEEVKMPNDNRYLKTILPELEKLKARTDEIVNSYLESIVSTKIKMKISHQLWNEILK